MDLLLSLRENVLKYLIHPTKILHKLFCFTLCILWNSKENGNLYRHVLSLNISSHAELFVSLSISLYIPKLVNAFISLTNTLCELHNIDYSSIKC